MADKFEEGLQIFSDVFGQQMADGARAYAQSDAFGAEQAKFAMEWAFGSVWARDGLDRKMRSCAVLGMLIGMRQSGEIGYHTKMGLANGLTKKEIEEILLTSVPYCGLPTSNVAKAAMMQAFGELDSAAAKKGGE